MSRILMANSQKHSFSTIRKFPCLISRGLRFIIPLFCFLHLNFRLAWLALDWKKLFIITNADRKISKKGFFGVFTEILVLN